LTKSYRFIDNAFLHFKRNNAGENDQDDQENKKNLHACVAMQWPMEKRFIAKTFGNIFSV
jgi:hypothetical protein